MAQRSIEVLIGRLITDEAFRAAFRTGTAATLARFIESGYDLTALELAAVRATPLDVWERTADQIDPRLQKAAFRRCPQKRSRSAALQGWPCEGAPTQEES